MYTTTRSRFTRREIWFDGISWGTPIGQIHFIWVNDDTEVEVHVEGKSVAKFTTDDLPRVARFANILIKNDYTNETHNEVQMTEWVLVSAKEN